MATIKIYYKIAVLIYLPVAIDLRTHVQSTTMVAIATVDNTG